MTSVGNLYTNLGGYFEVSFIIEHVGNLYAKLGCYFKIRVLLLSIFYNARGG